MCPTALELVLQGAVCCQMWVLAIQPRPSQEEYKPFRKHQHPPSCLWRKKECQALAAAAWGARSQPELRPVTHSPQYTHKEESPAFWGRGAKLRPLIEPSGFLPSQTGGLWKAIDWGVSRVWDPGPPDWGRAASSLRNIRLPAGLQLKEALLHLSLSSLILTSCQACGPTSGQLELDAAWVSRLQFRLFLLLIPKFLCSQPIIYLLITHHIIYLFIIYKLFITINYVLFIWGTEPRASCMLGKCSTTK